MNIKSYRTLEASRPVTSMGLHRHTSVQEECTPFDKYFPLKTATRCLHRGGGTGFLILQGGHKVFAPTGGADLSASKRSKDVRLRFLEFIENKQRVKAEIATAPMPIC